MSNKVPLPTGTNTEAQVFSLSLNSEPLRTHRILVANAKGGAGKTTVSTNLAGYYAARNIGAALLDYDPQGSSVHWLGMRSDEQFPIHGVHAYRHTGGMTRTFQLRLPSTTERVIMDAPAGVSGQQLIDLLRHTDTVIIPVLPSAIDIHATARFIQELLVIGKVRARGIRVGVIGNRMRPNSPMYDPLERFVASLNIPFVARFLDDECYVRSAESGISFHEESPTSKSQECVRWDGLVEWLDRGSARTGG